MKKTISILAVLVLVLSLCTSSFALDLSQLNYDDYFSARDLSGTWKAEDAQEIALSGSVTISEAGVYVLSGTVADGCVTVSAPKDAKVQLVLNGVSISAAEGPCLFVDSADKVFVTLAEGSENSLNSASFAEGTELNAALYSKADLVLNGKGSLSISSAAHGILGKDDVKFGGGVYVITAVGRGISGKDSVRIFDGSYTIESGKDPIRSKNTDKDGKGYVLIVGGTFYLNGNTAD